MCITSLHGCMFCAICSQTKEYHAFDSQHKVFEKHTKAQPAVLLNAGIFNYKRLVVPQKRKHRMCACYKPGKLLKSKSLLDSQQPASRVLTHIMQQH